MRWGGEEGNKADVEIELARGALAIERTREGGRFVRGY